MSEYPCSKIETLENHGERIAVLETEMKQIIADNTEIKHDLKQIRRHVGSVAQDITTLATSFKNSKSFLSGVVVAISVIFTGVLELLSASWDKILHLLHIK